jgi:hypothetical protein
MEEVKEPNPSDSTWENKDSGSAALSLEKFFLVRTIVLWAFIRFILKGTQISNEVLEGKRKISNFADYFKLASLHLHLHNLLLKTHKITNEYRFNVQQVDYFDILADEILQMILDEADFFSLINLSLCNKRLHKILCSEEGMRLKEQKFAEYMVPPAFRCSSSVKMLLLTIDLMKELQLVDLSLKDTILRYIHIVEDFEERLEEYRSLKGA